MCISLRVTVAFPEQRTTTSCVCGSPTAAAAAALWFQYLFGANTCLVSTAGQLGTCLIFGGNCEFADLFRKTAGKLALLFLARSLLPCDIAVISHFPLSSYAQCHCSVHSTHCFVHGQWLSRWHACTEEEDSSKGCLQAHPQVPVYIR